MTTEELRNSILSAPRNGYTRLTAQRLSFYDSNDIEVACISDRRLMVTEARVQQLETQSLTAGRLQLGAYLWELGNDGHLSIR